MSANSDIRVYMEKLYKTYNESGGNGDQNAKLKNKASFECQFLLLAEKLKVCRKEMLKRDDDKLTQSAKAKLNHRIRQM
jgi:hypothetical protein